MRAAGFVKGISILAAAAAALAAMSASSVPAQARDGFNGAILGGAAAGVAGGLVAGAIINNNRPAPVYADEEPVYAAPRPRYVRDCHMERRQVWLSRDEYTYRRVEVCE